MRQSLRLLSAFAVLAPLAIAAPAPAHAQAVAVPHAALFGAWTGGLFPAPSVISARTCLAQPTVVITRDVVLRATLTDVFYVQRQIETVRGTGGGVDIHLTPASAQQAAALVAGGAPGLGFGCDSPDLLRVQRLTPNQMTFPGCKDFPFPLVRCPAG